MFAGLPGIGVGTLFYVLISLWMPVREVGFMAMGRPSTWARWRLIATQLGFSAGILGSIAIADRVLLWSLGGANAPRAVGPARWLNDQLGSHAPKSILAAPIAASVILLGCVLLAVEAARMFVRLRQGRRRSTAPAIELTSGDTSAIAGAGNG